MRARSGYVVVWILGGWAAMLAACVACALVALLH